MTDTLFLDGIAAQDPEYCIIRDTAEPQIVQIKLFMEKLWQTYRPYADSNFRLAMAEDLDSRFWEMYLACTLIENSIPLIPRRTSAGPDILIERDGRRIWIEAIAPTSGHECNPDRVPELQVGVAMRVPDDEIVLRYTSAICDKSVKYATYLKTGIVGHSDAYIVAVNGCKIGAALAESDPPRIVRALLGKGFRFVSIDKTSRAVVAQGLQDHRTVQRAGGQEIRTDLLLQDGYRGLSGVLYSRASVRKLPPQMGGDFVFIHHPRATNPVSRGLVKVGTEWVPYDKPGSCEFRRTTWSGTGNQS